jgi:hypothetical protein
MKHPHMQKKWSVVATLVWAVVSALPIHANAVDHMSSGHVAEPPEGDGSRTQSDRFVLVCGGRPTKGSPEKDKEKLGLKVADLLPNAFEQLASVFKLEGEIADQPDFVWVEVELPDDQGSTFEPRVNPNRSLWKATLSADLSKLMTTPSELKTAYETAARNREWFDLSEDPVADVHDALAYFARARSCDFWGKRLLAGFSASFSVAEQPDELDGNNRELDGHVETFSVTWDPASLLVTGSDWEAAASTLRAYAQLSGRPELLGDQSSCKTPGSKRCLRQTSGLSGGREWFAALIPKLQFKTVDQFDYIKAGGQYFSTELSDKTIETYTITWDFGRAARLKRENAAAVRFLASASDKSGLAPPAIELPLAVTVEGGGVPVAPRELFYLQFETQKHGEGLRWSLMGRDCSAPTNTTGMEVLPGLRLRSDGLVAGYPEAVQPSEICVQVTDVFSRTDQVLCRIEGVDKDRASRSR